MEAAKGHIFLDGVGWWKLSKTWPSKLVPLVQFTFFHNLLPLLHFNPHLKKKKKEATIHNWHSTNPCCLYLPRGKPRADNKSYSEWQTQGMETSELLTPRPMYLLLDTDYQNCPFIFLFCLRSVWMEIKLIKHGYKTIGIWLGKSSFKYTQLPTENSF